MKMCWFKDHLHVLVLVQRPSTRGIVLVMVQMTIYTISILSPFSTAFVHGILLHSVHIIAQGVNYLHHIINMYKPYLSNPH